MHKVEFTDVNDEGFTLAIAVDEECAGVKVTGITMFVGTVNDEDDDDSEGWGYECGDLAVNWSMEGLTNNEDARTMGTLLLRDLHSPDDITKVMGEFYWQDGFTERLKEILQECGFSANATDDVTTSEWGMQDEGRASYDAYLIADEARTMQLQAA